MFIAGPAVYLAIDPSPRLLFPSLWAWGLVCLVLLLRDGGFERGRLGGVAGLRREWRPMLARFAVLGSVIVAAMAVFAPDRLCDLPREQPGLWAAIMVGYPLASVYPQEVIFRAFFFRRYAGLFSHRVAMVAASAVSFGYLHIIFGNPIAVAMTLVGGLLFATTYARSRSLLASSVEHSLYGCLVFTVGLGGYFYSGGL